MFADDFESLCRRRTKRQAGFYFDGANGLKFIRQLGQPVLIGLIKSFQLFHQMGIDFALVLDVQERDPANTGSHKLFDVFESLAGIFREICRE